MDDTVNRDEAQARCPKCFLLHSPEWTCGEAALLRLEAKRLVREQNERALGDDRRRPESES